MTNYTILIEQGQDGFLIGSVIELPGCRTQAKDQPTLMSRLKEAIELFKEVEDYTPSSFIGLQTIAA